MLVLTTATKLPFPICEAKVTLDERPTKWAVSEHGMEEGLDERDKKHRMRLVNVFMIVSHIVTSIIR